MPHTSTSARSAHWRGPLALRLLYVRGVLPPEIEIIPCGDRMHFRFNDRLYLTRIGMKATGYEKTIRYYDSLLGKMERYSARCRVCGEMIVGGAMQ